MSTPLPSRRPLRSRDTTWARFLGETLARRGVSPNAISIAGLVAALLAGAALVATARVGEGPGRALFAAAAALVQLRLLANLLDGMVALATGRASSIGELYNEIPDRVADAAVLIGLGFAAGSEPVLGWGAALVAVFVAYVRVAAAHAGAPVDYCGPMAKQQRMAVVTAVALALALFPVSWLEALPLPEIALGIVLAGGALTAARRIRRAARVLRELEP